jgi:uncharacterized protein with FMN-binding domain
MRRALASTLGALALALPNANAWAAVASTQATPPKTKVVTATRTFTGVAYEADRWGELQVAIVVRKTTTTNLGTGKKTVKKKIVSVKTPVYPNHTSRSVFINQDALPILIQETIQAQRASIDFVSRATDTSEAFEGSLQSAILKSKGW